MKMYQCDDSWESNDYTFWISENSGTTWATSSYLFTKDWCEGMLAATPLVFQQNVLENE